MMKTENILLIFILFAAIMPGCIDPPDEDTTTTTLQNTSSTIYSTTTTDVTTTTSITTSTTTTEPIIITTTTTTTTTIIYKPTTTIANARCYMNSDCGEKSIRYYCKVELIEGTIQPETRGETVYRVTYSPICLDPGTPWASCTSIRSERTWDECTEYEHCISKCFRCVPLGITKCPYY